MTRKIAFIGGGNMAHALATRMAAAGTDSILVAEPVAEQRARFAPPVATGDDNLAAARAADAVVLAVKPNVVEAVARQIAPAIGTRLVISIAAGVPIAAVDSWLGGGKPVVRAVPNTPALMGAGISGLVANAATSAEQRDWAASMLAAAGEVVWFDTDTDLDAVTAISGSGPAYFFYVIEALANAGVDLGLTPDVAKRLVVATAAGAAAMAATDDPVALRRRVTSPGGTTQRALSILADNALPEALLQAVRGAFNRSREMAQEFGKHE